MAESLASLRRKAKEMRDAYMAGPLSRATADKLKSEIEFHERAVKAAARVVAAAEKKAAKVEEAPEKKKTTAKAIMAADTRPAPRPAPRVPTKDSPVRKGVRMLSNYEDEE
jgi:hypothetical protein